MKPKTTAKKSGTHPNERLCDAAIKGNLDLTLIDTLIAEGANVDEVFRGGNTALHYAAQCGHAGVVESLLARKANIDMLNEIGLTAFVRACCDGKEKVVEAFLRNGRVDLNNILNNGYTALHHVAVTGKTEVVNLLLDNQAKTDVLDKNGFTAFVVACFYGQEKVVEAFLKKEVDFDKILTGGRTALHYAARNGHAGVVNLLLAKQAKTDVLDENGKSPLDLAIFENKKEVIKVLCNVEDKFGMTFIHRIAKLGNTKMIEFLFEKGAEIDKIDDKLGKTPLHIAIENNQTETALALIRLGSNIEVADINGMTPLLIAAQNGNVEIFKLLLKKGANIEAADINGMRITHFAAQNGNAEIFEFLPKDKIPSKTFNPIGENNNKPVGNSPNKGRG